jgi:hypothetical protein
MSKEIRCLQCQTVLATLPDDDPHTFPQPVLCAACMEKKASAIERGISNDQTASKRGRARVRLQELLPHGSEIAALQVNQHTNASAYSPVFEYYLFTIRHGRILLLTSYLRDLGGFGVNRRRGTLRTNDRIDRLISLIGIRVHDDPNAFIRVDIDPEF